MTAPASPQPRRFPPRLAVLVIVAVVVQVGALAGLGYLGVTALGHDSGTIGALAEPVRLRQVTALHGTPCRSGELTEHGDSPRQCYRLGDGMTITELESISVENSTYGAGWVIDLSLGTRDAASFADLTGRLVREQSPRNQLAIVVGHHVVSAPEVQSRISGGEVQIAGSFTQDEAQHLADQITG